MEKTYKQYELLADDARLIVWLEEDKRLTKGKTLTLKETGDIVWAVGRQYSTVRSDKDMLFTRKWNNNI